MKAAKFKTMGVNGRVEVREGFSHSVKIGGKSLPVTLHQFFGVLEHYWVLSDAATGCIIGRGETKGEAIRDFQNHIKGPGSKRFYAVRSAWKRIILGGVSIQKYKKKTYSVRNHERACAWSQRTKKKSVTPNEGMKK